jgi:hypothetical protein
MNIEQLVIDFNSVEDRLLLSLHTDGPSIRIWLTRRYVGLLRDALAEILNVELTAVQPLAVGSPVLLAELMHEQAISSLNLSSPPVSRHFDGATPQHADAPNESPAPIAAAPKVDAWLAFKLEVFWDESDKARRVATGLSISPQEGNGITLNLNESLPHALVQMLSQACESAEWGIDFVHLGAHAKSTTSSFKTNSLH